MNLSQTDQTAATSTEAPGMNTPVTNSGVTDAERSSNMSAGVMGDLLLYKSMLHHHYTHGGREEAVDIAERLLLRPGESAADCVI